MEGRKVTYHKFPRDETLFKQWIIKIKRDEGPLFEVTRHTKVCSKHFTEDNFVPNVASGKRILRDDAVPSVFSFGAPKSKPRRPLVRRTILLETNSNAAAFVEQENIAPQEQLPERASSPRADLQALQEELAHIKEVSESKEKAIQKLTAELEELKTQLQMKTDENHKLIRELEICKGHCKKLEEDKKPFCVERFQCSDNDFQFYTGLPNYATFCALLRYLDPGDVAENIVPWNTERSSSDADASGSRGRPQKLSAENQLFLVLVKLRLGVFHQHLGHLFGVSTSYVSRTLTAWLNFMYLQLGQLPLWQSRETVDRSMPAAFLESYPTTRVIIDATEVYCEAPSSFVLQSRTYSNYKSAHTFKGLIGIAPSGAVTFVSDLFTGSMSDRECVIRSGFLHMDFSENDSVMADKGFKIADLLEPLNVHLNIPPFLRQPQFSQQEIAETQDIASLRIHVERRIQRIKTFHIFDRPIPVTLGPVINQIWTVCVILTNFQSPIIKSAE
ncbi:uncharacterized protein LOC135367543 [Ornithodoros turicata]|uniref:uncharacterized protein LOC135367543 n=1 Tax=Ornithodoros turicata TaxID=34597 RepID=UPI003138BBF8